MLMSLYGLRGCFSRFLTGMAASDVHVDGKLLYMGSYIILGLGTIFLLVLGTSFSLGLNCWRLHQFWRFHFYWIMLVCLCSGSLFVGSNVWNLMILTMKKSKSINERHNTEKKHRNGAKPDGEIYRKWWDGFFKRITWSERCPNLSIQR